MTFAEISVGQLAELIETDPSLKLVDVREPDEFAGGHVPVAVSVPLGVVPDLLDEFSSSTSTYVICQSGGRSARACEYVSECAPERTVVNVAGGTLAWILSGRAVVA